MSAVPSGATVAGEARRHHRDHVDIALDRDHGRALVRGGARGGAVVERRALVEERRLGRVQVFRRRVLIERAAAERDDAAAEIGDRKHHAIAEAIVGHRNVVARDQQAPPRSCPRRETPLAPRCSFSAKRSARRVAEAETELRRGSRPRSAR